MLGAVALGGFAGGEARYLLGLAFPTGHATFPATTFAINVSGSFVLALLLVLILEVWPPTKYLRPLLCTGFCGAYTTFSTWMVDTDRLVSARPLRGGRRRPVRLAGRGHRRDAARPGRRARGARRTGAPRAAARPPKRTRKQSESEALR